MICKASVATVVKCTYCRLEREKEVRKRPRPKSGQVSLRLLGGVSRRYLLVMQAAGEVHGGRWSVSPVFSLVGLLRFVFVRLFAREAAKAELVIAKEEGPEGAVTVVAMVLFHEIRNPAYSIFNKRPPTSSQLAISLQDRPAPISNPRTVCSEFRSAPQQGVPVHSSRAVTKLFSGRSTRGKLFQVEGTGCRDRNGDEEKNRCGFFHWALRYRVNRVAITFSD